MKRIVICYDGTWNALTDPQEVTNVVRVGQAVKKADENGSAQIVYYNAGVGSGGPLDRFLGGVFGLGLRDNVKRGLAYLTLNWEEGDEIYIFGFSRGAYSARALAGVITAIGGVPRKEHFDCIEEIWSFYRLTPRQRRDPEYRKKYRIDERVDRSSARFLIKCLAVWDTVGSYGIPAGLGLGGLARKFTSWTRGFHDNRLHPQIEVGLQALAIDEQRRSFAPTTWVGEHPSGTDGQTVEQVWFVGAHSNVGGGYHRTGLSDLALIWIMARVESLTKMRFNEDYIGKNFWPCAACSLYRSNRGWWVSRIFPLKRLPFPKAMPMEIWFEGKKERKSVVPVGEKIHWSVIERLGRDAIVDEKITKLYIPRNVPAHWRGRYWRDENRPAIERDERVAQRTKREADLIALCRQRANDRFSKCALFCDIGSAATDKAGTLTRLSSKKRRMRRLHRLQKIWNMDELQQPPSTPGLNERDVG
jgi:Uncharacterized alpha/beta hydrolase domain (DUF2235)